MIHAGALAGYDFQPHHPRLRRRIHIRGHLGGEVALGRCRLARLAHRLVDEPLQALGIHLRIEAPAHDVEALLQALFQLAGRLDLDGVLEAGAERGVAEKNADGERRAHAR
jgi:hypothetical protein